MKVLVIGGQGLLGSAIATQFVANNHDVTLACRQKGQKNQMCIDFRFDANEETLRHAVRGFDIVVNAVGVLIEKDGNTWEAVHTQAAHALAAACAAERVARVVHISALGAGTGIPGAYMASKLAAEDAYKAHPTDYAIVRPGLLVDAACPSTQFFGFLARMPIVALPGLLHTGASQLAPIAVADVARCVLNIATHPKALRRVIELAGIEALSYKQMLHTYRTAQGNGPTLWLPLPWWLMHATALLAQWLPQKVFSINTMRILQAGCVSQRNEVERWLGREPTPWLNAAGLPDTAPRAQPCPVPEGSQIAAHLPGASFYDAYCIEVQDAHEVQTTALGYYLQAVVQTPRWVARFMALRNGVVGCFGLKNLGTLSHVNHQKQEHEYQSGDRIGIFTLRSNTPDELIVFDDDKHLEVLLSVRHMPLQPNGKRRIVLTTVVHIHNTLGRLYMLPVTPMHKLIAPAVLERVAIRSVS